MRRKPKDHDQPPLGTPSALRGVGLRTAAHQIVARALTEEIREHLIESTQLDLAGPAGDSFLAGVADVLQDCFIAKQSLDREPVRRSKQRAPVEKLLRATRSFRTRSGVAAWGSSSDRIPVEVWYKLRLAGFDDQILRVLLIRHPVARFDQKNPDKLRADVKDFERVHGRIGLEPRDVLERLMAALEAACVAALNEPTLKDTGGAPTTIAERITVCQLAQVYLRRLAVYAVTDPDSFTGQGTENERTEDNRRKEFVRTGKKVRVDFVREAMRTIDVNMTRRAVEKIVEDEDAARPFTAPRWFFDNRRELAAQERQRARPRGSSKKPR